MLSTFQHTSNQNMAATAAPAPPAGNPGATAPPTINLGTAISKMKPRTVQEITSYVKTHCDPVTQTPPTGAINTFCGLTDCEHQGDPNIDTAPWFLGMVNGTHHILTGLDYAKPPTDPPNFLLAPPFHTKSYCIAIGD